MAKPRTTEELALAAAEYESTMRLLAEERDLLRDTIEADRKRRVADAAAIERLHTDEMNRMHVDLRVAQAENETLRTLLKHEQLQSRTYGQFAAEISQSLVHVRGAAQHLAQTVDDVVAKANAAAHEVLAAKSEPNKPETNAAVPAPKPFGAPGTPPVSDEQPLDVPAFITKRNEQGEPT